MKTLLVALVVALVGCGEVTEVPDQLQTADGGAPDGVAEMQASPPARPDLGGGSDTVPTSDASPPTTCTVATSCASCPGFPRAGQCAAIVECVRAGGQGEYPWQSCSNAHPGAAVEGIMCAQLVAKDCP